MRQIAIIGPTASGKSALAIEYAQKNSANIRKQTLFRKISAAADN